VDIKINDIVLVGWLSQIAPCVPHAVVRLITTGGVLDSRVVPLEASDVVTFPAFCDSLTLYCPREKLWTT